MKRKPKSALTILCAAAIAFCSLPQNSSLLLQSAITAGAADASGTCGENLTWTLDSEGTLTISGKGDMEDFDVVLDEKSWSFYSNAPWIKEYRYDIKNVVIEEGVTSIGKGAFCLCCFVSIIVPNGVTSIGAYAFNDCRNLTEITIPDSVMSIGDNAFSECAELTKINLPDSLTSIGDNAFASCMKLSEITIPDSVTSIGSYAFFWNPWLEEQHEEHPFVIVNGILIEIAGINEEVVAIPDGVTSIAGGAFCSCYDMTSVIIPESVTSIGKEAFWGNSALTSVTIPDSVASIGNRAFVDCTDLTEIIIPFNVTSIGENAFMGCEKVTIKGYADSYAEAYARQNQIPFEALAAPEPEVYGGMKYEIMDGEVWIVGFTDDLPAVLEIPAEIDGKPVTGFSQFAFAQCDRLKEVTLPESVTSFGMQTFWGCKNLEKVTLPSGLKSVYEAAFAQCTALKSITIPDGCETIGNLVFSGCTALCEVNIPASVKNFFEPAFEDTPWLEAKRAENPLVVVNGILIDAQTAKGAVTVPEGVTAICAWAVMDNSTITAMTLPKSLEKLDSIESCSALTEVTFLNPDCVIDDDPNTIRNGHDEQWNPYFNGTIRGYAGSTAEAFSKKNGYAFESLGEVPAASVIGDFDGDGEASMADAVLLVRFVTEDITLTAEQVESILTAGPDMDEDGTVSILDVTSFLMLMQKQS